MINYEGECCLCALRHVARHVGCNNVPHSRFRTTTSFNIFVAPRTDPQQKFETYRQIARWRIQRNGDKNDYAHIHETV